LTVFFADQVSERQATMASSLNTNTDSFQESTLQIIVQPHIQQLLESPKTGFTSDDEYLSLLESIFSVFFIVYDSRELLSRNMLGFLDKVTTTDMDQKRNIYDGLNSLLQQLRNRMQLRLSHCKPPPSSGSSKSSKSSKSSSSTTTMTTSDDNPSDSSSPKPKPYEPRLERLSRKFQLTEKEKTALQYIIMANIGITFPTNQRSYEGRGMLRNMAILSGMSSREVLNFLAPNRKHMKDCLFEASDDALSFEFSGTTFKMSKETLSAIMGCKLTSEQFLAVDNTTLGELLVEEGVSPSNLPSASSPKGGNTQKVTFNADDVGGDDDEDVFALLKTLANDDIDGDGDAKIDDGDSVGDGIGDEESKEDAVAVVSSGNINEIAPYEDDLDYLKDHFKVIELRYRTFVSKLEEEDAYRFSSKKSQKTTVREYKSSGANAYKKCMARLAATKQHGKWLPRLERLVVKRNLDEFEKWVILTLIGCIISVDIIKAAQLQNRYRDPLTVGDMLAANCEDLRQQIEYRKYFYKTGTLVKENIIKVHESRLLHNSDLMHSNLEIDRRMVDYCVALDTEFGALVEGSSLYTPNVTLDQVVLSKSTKQLILDTLDGMEQFKKQIKSMERSASGSTAPSGLNNANYIGNGVVMMFHGQSGTGKTMMANAIAHHLSRKILLINYSQLSGTGEQKAEDLLNLSFREAKIQNAVIFFDECEGLFESRDLRGNKNVNIVLNAIEQYDDIIILATNRPFDLDEAMYRRIHLAVEFPAPDVHLREQIWRQHVPEQVQLADDVDLYALSTEYELTGGFIRNAVLTALKAGLLRRNRATSDDAGKSNEAPLVLSQQDLRSSCRQCIVGQLALTGFSRRVIPSKRLQDLALNRKEKDTVKEIIARHKSSKVLSGQWGFEPEGQCILIMGEGGVGKSTLAEVIAFECGKPMKLLTCSELLHLNRTTFATKSGNGADSVFSDLNSGAVLVIEGSEILFRDGYGHDNIINYLLFQIRRVTTMFIFICQGTMHSGSVLSLSPIQKTLFSHFHFILKLPKPSRELRARLFVTMIPKQTPVDETVNEKTLMKLCEKFPKFVHSEIQRVIIKAASSACLRKDEKKRVLTYKDLQDAAVKLEEEMENDGRRMGFHHMYS